MMDLIYDLSPSEGITCIEGHLLILVTDASSISEAVESLLESKIRKLDDTSEFWMAFAPADKFLELSAKVCEFPALFHFVEGTMRESSHGADDCVEFFEEFVEANKCKRNGKTQR
jgi:hypothetical protein